MHMSSRILSDQRKINNHREIASINWAIQICLTYSQNVRRVWFKEGLTVTIKLSYMIFYVYQNSGIHDVHGQLQKSMCQVSYLLPGDFLTIFPKLVLIEIANLANLDRFFLKKILAFIKSLRIFMCSILLSSIFLIFLSFFCCKKTDEVSIYKIIKTVFWLGIILDRFLKNCIKL